MIKINVLKRDIEKGEEKDCEYCPVALAVKRATHHRVGVAGDVVEIYRGVYSTSYYSLPAKAINFIKRFDGGKSVKPFSFKMTPDRNYAYYVS